MFPDAYTVHIYNAECLEIKSLQKQFCFNFIWFKNLNQDSAQSTDIPVKLWKLIIILVREYLCRQHYWLMSTYLQ